MSRRQIKRAVKSEKEQEKEEWKIIAEEDRATRKRNAASLEEAVQQGGKLAENLARDSAKTASDNAKMVRGNAKMVRINEHNSMVRRLQQRIALNEKRNKRDVVTKLGDELDALLELDSSCDSAADTTGFSGMVSI